MSPKERWEAVLNHRLPDRVPMDYWGTTETTTRMMRFLGCSTPKEMFQKLHIDHVVKLEASYVGPPLAEDTDAFGCTFKKVDYGTGHYAECIHNPLAGFTDVGEIEKTYTWPDPDWWDYDDLPLQLSGMDDYPVLGGHYEPFLIYKNLRGEQQAYSDLLMNPAMVHYCLDKLFALAVEDITRMYLTLPGKIQLTYVAEDMGGQEDLLISPGQIRTFLLPRIKKVIEMVHQAGVRVFHHNDGAVQRIIPDLVETGIDILNPVQWRCKGMDRKSLKENFGGKVVFHGAMDNQETLPFGATHDVIREVLENIDLLGKGGGFILAPCHNIQPLTPPENIIAMYTAGYENGWY